MYGYTRDHLGLMIRRGKLNGVKLGSYYVTTNEWMTEYVKDFAALNHPTLKNKLSNKFLAGALSAKKSLPIIVANTLKVSRNNSAKTVKPIKGKALQYDTDNGLKEIILKELVRYANPSGADIAPKIETGCLEQSIKVARAGNQFPMPSDAPYVILPIRKMKNTEREEVLRKVP